MTDLSRREFLEGLASAYAMAGLGCGPKGDRFAREHVCIHIFHPGEFVAAPLMEKTRPPASRAAEEDCFGIGLPELVVCTTRTSFLDMFQYFWPFSRADLAHLEQSIQVRYSKPTVNGTADIDDFVTYLRDHRSELAQGPASSAVIFTYTDFTRHWVSEAITASRQAAIQEFVLFKDPTLAPYLCTYLALQKGFKRPPP